jgi:hypothetical protein
MIKKYKRNYKKCSKCDKLISLSNFEKHFIKCDGSNSDIIKIKEEWLQENGLYKCPHCDKLFTKKGICSHIWRKHTEEGLKFDKERPNGMLGKKAWNKDLTKETDKRVKKQSDTSLEKFKNGETKIWCDGLTKDTDERLMKISKLCIEKKTGGYKKGGGRSKKGWYKNFWCESSWELAWVVYNLEHNIKFERNKKGFKYIFENVESLYYPDFILETGEYIEIKNYETECVKAKIKYFPYKLKLLYEKDLKEVFEYVVEKYGKDYIKLYEKRKLK